MKNTINIGICLICGYRKKLIMKNLIPWNHTELIEEKVPQRERLIKLNNSARRQMEALKDNKSLKDLEFLQKQVNENMLIEQ